jgi:hypothetical protein
MFSTSKVKMSRRFISGHLSTQSKLKFSHENSKNGKNPNKYVWHLKSEKEPKIRMGATRRSYPTEFAGSTENFKKYRNTKTINKNEKIKKKLIVSLVPQK